MRVPGTVGGAVTHALYSYALMILCKKNNSLYLNTCGFPLSKCCYRLTGHIGDYWLDDLFSLLCIDVFPRKIVLVFCLVHMKK